MADNSVGPMSQRAGSVSQRCCLAAVPRFPHPSEATGAPSLGCQWGWGFLGWRGERRQRGQGDPLKWSPTSRSEAILVCIMNKGSKGGGETPKPELAGRQACPPCLPSLPACPLPQPPVITGLLPVQLLCNDMFAN